MRNHRLFGLVVAMLLVAAGCGDDEPAATTAAIAETTTTTSAPVTTTTAPPETTTAPAATTTTTTTEPPAPAIPPGAMLITNEDGVYVGTLDGVVSQVIAGSPTEVGGMIAFAIDDTSGGVVFQPSLFGVGADTIVYWVPQASGDYQELLVPADDQRLALEDVVAHGGVPVVYYTRRELSDDPESARQTLRSFNTDTKTVEELATVGGWESGSWNISAGGDMIASNGSGEAWYWVNFYDLDGNLIESPANPLPDDGEDCVPADCFFYADLSPDGSHLASARLAPNANGFPMTPQIEVRSTATGELEMAVSLPPLSASGYIDSLDLSEDFVLINVVEEGSEYPVATIVDIASGGTTTYRAPIDGVARFLRSVPNLDGVVTWP